MAMSTADFSRKVAQITSKRALQEDYMALKLRDERERLRQELMYGKVSPKSSKQLYKRRPPSKKPWVARDSNTGKVLARADSEQELRRMLPGRNFSVEDSRVPPIITITGETVWAPYSYWNPSI